MKNPKKPIALLIALILAAGVLAGCGSQPSNQPTTPTTDSPSPSPQSPGTIGDVGETQQPPPGTERVTSDETLRVLLDQEPNVLTPQYSSPSSPGMTIGYAIFATLFRWNNETQAADPYLATGFEWVDDRNIRISLREGVIGHD